MKRGRAPGLPRPEPWKPVDLPYAEACALQALSKGSASEIQQRMAYSCLVHMICGTYDQDFRPDEFGGDRGTCFAAGKRQVGLELTKYANMNVQKVYGKQPLEEGRVG